MQVPTLVTRSAAAGRRLSYRRPWIRWVVVAALAGVAGLGVHRGLERLESARAAWGATREVLVAAADTAAGDTLDVVVREVPVALVPDRAVLGGDAADVTGPPRARRDVRAGAVLVDLDVAPPGGGPAALADPGQVVVAVHDPLIGELPIGTRVAVYSDGIIVAGGARVVSTTPAGSLVAVDERDGPLVALAAHEGRAALAVVP